MANREQAKSSISEITIGQPSITDDFTSSTSEAVSPRHHDVETGHERLLKHTASNEGKSIQHCRASRPPHYLLLAVLVYLVVLYIITTLLISDICRFTCRLVIKSCYWFGTFQVAVLNFPFGIPAVVCSLLSKHNHRNGKYERAKHWGNVSKWLSIVGLAVFAVTIAFTIVYFVHIQKNIVDTPEELNAT